MDKKMELLLRKREVGLLKRKKIETFQVIFYDLTGLSRKNWYLSECRVGHEGK